MSTATTNVGTADQPAVPTYIDREGRTHRVTVEPHRRRWRIRDRQGRTVFAEVDDIENAEDSERFAHGIAADYARQQRLRFGNPEPDDGDEREAPLAA